jgi:hypothetical protein
MTGTGETAKVTVFPVVEGALGRVHLPLHERIDQWNQRKSRLGPGIVDRDACKMN